MVPVVNILDSHMHGFDALTIHPATKNITKITKLPHIYAASGFYILVSIAENGFQGNKLVRWVVILAFSDFSLFLGY